MSVLAVSLILLGSYFLGSIPFGLFVAKARGVDIRKHGSGNIGATNVFRVCGKGAGIVVFALDFLKGLIPVLAAERWLVGAWPVVAGILAILGHVYPCWLRFKGGKGIATSAGVLAALLPLALLGALVVWLLTFAVTRYVSVASIAAAAAVPVAVVAMRLHGRELHRSYVIVAFVVAGLALWRHRSNIQRLLAGTEHRFSRKSKS